MNVSELTPDTNGTLSLYFAVVIPLTILTAWVIIAFQSKYMFPGTSFIKRLAWPIFVIPMFSRKSHPPAEKLDL